MLATATATKCAQIRKIILFRLSAFNFVLFLVGREQEKGTRAMLFLLLASCLLCDGNGAGTGTGTGTVAGHGQDWLLLRRASNEQSGTDSKDSPSTCPLAPWRPPSPSNANEIQTSSAEATFHSVKFFACIFFFRSLLTPARSLSLSLTLVVTDVVSVLPILTAGRPSLIWHVSLWLVKKMSLSNAQQCQGQDEGNAAAAVASAVALLN